MTSIFQIDEQNDKWQVLHSGVLILAEHHYTAGEAKGVLAVAISSIISALAILILLFAILISLLRRPSEGAKKDKRQTFIRSHAGIYFICMIISNLIFTVGFLLSIVWAVERKITFGTFCTAQAALKQFGNVATAIWVLVIAAHTFAIVFLQMRIPNWVFYITFSSSWLLSGAIIAAGPLFYVTDAMGPWYGISAQWCWTSDSYVMPRFTTEYFWMFLAAATSFILYLLLFLKLRGNISSTMRFHLRAQPVGPEASRVGNQMLWYPVAYALLVFPIAGCRIYELKTATLANLDLKMASAALFMFSGLVNVILYTFTRRLFPLPKFLRRKGSGSSSNNSTGNSNPNLVNSNTSSNTGVFVTRGRSTAEKMGISRPIPVPLSRESSESLNKYGETTQDSYTHSEKRVLQPAYPILDKFSGLPVMEQGQVQPVKTEKNRKSGWGWTNGGRTIKKPQPVWSPAQPTMQEPNGGYGLDHVRTRSDE